MAAATAQSGEVLHRLQPPVAPREAIHSDRGRFCLDL